MSFHQLQMDRGPITEPLWRIGWVLLVALGWLLPNHYPPWPTFHLDAWSSTALAIGAVALLTRTKGPVQWPWLAAGTAVLAVVPWLQFTSGMLPFAGQAWMSSSYLLGFTLAVLIGLRWERAYPDKLPNMLFLAVGLAGVVSVWLQLATWLELLDNGFMDIWSAGLSGNRPYANLAQPNNLASLLIWGLLGCLWAYVTKYFSSATSIVVCVFLLTGIALTQSRAGLLTISVLLCMTWFWRQLWPTRRLPWLATAMYGLYWLIPFMLKWLYTALLLGSDVSYLRLQQQGELRLAAWRLFFYAALERPWFGYGWTELGTAQLAMADQFPTLGSPFGQAHNLLLDLMLWVGLPLGLLVGGLLMWWFWKKFRAVTQATDAILMMVLGVMGIHSMVEFPLYQAYFLLPTGLVAGVVCARKVDTYPITTPRWTLAALLSGACLVMGMIIADYFHVEASYNTLRFEQARIGLGKAPIGTPPEVLTLTQMREWMRLARFKVHVGMSSEELKWMEDVTGTRISAGGLYRLAMALALNNQPQKATKILGKICPITDDAECNLIQRAWSDESAQNLSVALATWPTAASLPVGSETLN